MVCIGSVGTPPAHAAFEALRAVSFPAAFDPLRPSLHFWQRSPARLLDAAPRVHLAGAQPYGLSALQTASVDGHARLGSVGTGLSISSLGKGDYYGELLAAAGFAWQPRPPLALGLSLEYGRVQAGRRFEALHEWALGAGARARLGRHVSLDAATLGWTLAPRSRSSRLFASRFTAGFTLHYSQALTLRASALALRQWNIGETVRIGEHLVLSADLVTSPLRLAVGLLFQAGPLGFDLLYRDHPQLGSDVVLGVLLFT